MAEEWIETGGGATDIKKEEGKDFVGTYQGSHAVKGNYGDTQVYDFVGDDGAPFSIWGFSALDYLMQNQPVGSYLKIQYTGMKKGVKTKFGVKDIHTAKVFRKPGGGFVEQAPANKKQTNDDLPF